MTLAELKSLVKKGEGQHLEFKKKADYPDKIVKEMVAFANSGGGTLLLGVDDSGQLSGLRYPDEEQFVMEAAISKYARPPIPFQLFSIALGQGVFVLAYLVESGKEKPYFWLSDKQNQIFRAFVRSADQSIQASKEMFQVLKQEKIRAAFQPFRLNELEKKMLAHFGEKPTMTLNQLVQIGEMPRRKASQMLVNWVRQGVLQIHPDAREDLYRLSPRYSGEAE
jgi:predicted HTH transcriptional regulator